MYDYRNMTPSQRREAVEYRRLRERPWHSPPHWKFQGLLQFMISGACYEHHHIIGLTPERMTECEGLLLELCNQFATNVYAWCLLPNHYHLLLQTDQLQNLRKALGQLHGRTSFKWNGEDGCRGRQVWHNCLDRGIKVTSSLLGKCELYSSQPSSSWVCGQVDGVAVVKCRGLRSAGRSRNSLKDLA